MAHLSQDDGLKEAFSTGEDLHTFVASRAFGVPVEQVDPELRRRVKAMSYGLAYGLSAYGLATQLRISTDEAKEQMTAYFERFGGIRDYLRDVVGAGPQGRLHLHHPRPPPLPARPDERQRPAPRDGRADGAERADPGQRRRRHQARDARGVARRCATEGMRQPAAAAGPRRARARGRRRRARGARGTGPPGDGLAPTRSTSPSTSASASAAPGTRRATRDAPTVWRCSTPRSCPCSTPWPTRAPWPGWRR